MATKVAFSRERLEAAVAKVGNAIKKLTAIKEQVSLLTSRVAELKKLKEKKEAEAAAAAEAPPAPPPEGEPVPEGGPPPETAPEAPLTDT
jgi:hypothetical protein